MISDEAWTIELVEEDFELPGWLFVPDDLDGEARGRWMADAAGDLEGIADVEGASVGADAVRRLLEQALAERAVSDSHAMFQVWPPLRGETVSCHVNILASEGLPDWTEPTDDAVVHPAESPQLGPGLQCTTRRILQLDDGREVEQTGVHFVFDNGAAALLLSLDEADTLLVVRALPAFVMLMQNIRLVRESDGTPFTAVAPGGLLDDGPWKIEEPA